MLDLILKEINHRLAEGTLIVRDGRIHEPSTEEQRAIKANLGFLDAVDTMTNITRFQAQSMKAVFNKLEPKLKPKIIELLEQFPEFKNVEEFNERLRAKQENTKPISALHFNVLRKLLRESPNLFADYKK